MIVMLKNSVLLFCLALNSLLSYSESNSTLSEKHKILTNDIPNESSDDSSYKSVEKILNKRNSELKDLYLQNDYVVKPEFLEWQVFFSAFYNNRHRGGSKENVTIKKDEEDGEGKGKNISITVREIARDQKGLNVAPINVPAVNRNIPGISIKEPKPMDFEVLDVFGDGPPVPSASPDEYFDEILSSPPTGTRTNLIAYNNTGSKIFENLNVNSPSGTTITWDGSSSSTLVMNGITNYNNGGVLGSTAATENHTGQGTSLSINNIGINGDYNITGDWTLNMNIDNTQNTFAFISYKPYYITANSSVTNNGTLILDARGSMTQNFAGQLVGMGLDLANPSAVGQPIAKLENKGNIIIHSNKDPYNLTTIGMQLESLSSNSTISGELINSGKITVTNAPDLPSESGQASAILINVGTVSPTANIKTGNIDLLADNSNGITIGQAQRNLTLPNLTIDGSGGVINVVGYGSTAMIVGTPLGQATSTNTLENIRNININLNGMYGRGIVIDFSKPFFQNKPVVLNDQIIQSITVGPNSIRSSLIKNFGANIIIDSSLANAITNNSGESNFVIFNINGTLINHMPIIVGNEANKGVGIINLSDSETPASLVTNYGDITINSSPQYSDWFSMGIQNLSGTTRNFGNITMSPDYSMALYAESGNLISNTGNITVNGDHSVAVFSGYTDLSKERTFVNFESGDVTVNAAASVAFYLFNGSMSIGSSGNTVTATINGKNSYLFHSRRDDGTREFTPFTINGNINAQVKNMASAFEYSDSNINLPTNPIDFSAYLAELIQINNGTLNIDIDPDSYIFTVHSAIVNLSSLNNLHLDGLNLTGSKKSLINNSTLNVDIDSNLDLLNTTGNKLYRDLDIFSTSVTINSGITVSGTEDNQAAIAQAPGAYTDLKNNGIINLSGKNAIGIYGQIGTSENNGTINLENGIGMYTEVDSYVRNDTTNTSAINIGSNGIGIYGKTGEESILTITNSGTIIGTGNNPTGIYINNNGLSATADMTLSPSSNIDMRNSTNGIGIYTNNTNIAGTGAGTITVGENGVGVYANNGTATFPNIKPVWR